MAILQAEIEIRLSGGAANSDPNASLGGAMSSTTITTDTLNNMFDDVSGDESASGDTEYRCFYFCNTNSTPLDWQSPVFWIESNTPSGDTAVRIALGTAAVGVAEQTIADESTAPSGVSWSTAVNKGSGLALGTNIPGNSSYKAIWVERVVTSPASAYNNDTYTVKGEGETAA